MQASVPVPVLYRAKMGLQVLRRPLANRWLFGLFLATCLAQLGDTITSYHLFVFSSSLSRHSNYESNPFLAPLLNNGSLLPAFIKLLIIPVGVFLVLALAARPNPLHHRITPLHIAVVAIGLCTLVSGWAAITNALLPF